MPPFHLAVSGFIVIFSAASALAAPVAIDAKTGLWEVNSTTTHSGMPSMPSIPAADLAKLPPAQRAQIEAMLQLHSGAPQSSTRRICVTEEELKGFIPKDMEEDCTSTILKSTPREQEIKIVCNGKGQGTGLVKVSIPTRTSMISEMQMDVTAEGLQMSMNTKSQGRWIADDCGDVTD